MSKIYTLTAAEISDKVCELALTANMYLPEDVAESLRKARAAEKLGRAQSLYDEIIENAKLAAEQAVKEMLPVFENLERIAAAINDPESGMAKGMAMVIRQFSDGLCKLGLEFIPTEGPFDPALHEAISMEPVDDESKDGHIIGAVSRGYKLAGRVLKAPQVRVGKYNG